MSEWEKFALDQYRILVTEDDNDGNENDDVYEDDFEVGVALTRPLICFSVSFSICAGDFSFRESGG